MMTLLKKKLSYKISNFVGELMFFCFSSMNFMLLLQSQQQALKLGGIIAHLSQSQESNPMCISLSFVNDKISQHFAYSKNPTNHNFDIEIKLPLFSHRKSAHEKGFLDIYKPQLLVKANSQKISFWEKLQSVSILLITCFLLPTSFIQGRDRLPK